MSGPLQLSILELLGGERWDGGSCQSKVDGGGHGLYALEQSAYAVSGNQER